MALRRILPRVGLIIRPAESSSVRKETVAALQGVPADGRKNRGGGKFPRKNKAAGQAALLLICLTGSVLAGFCVLGEGVSLLDRNLLIVAGEDAVDLLFGELGSDKAYEGNDNETCKHCECTGVDR